MCHWIFLDNVPLTVPTEEVYSGKTVETALGPISCSITYQLWALGCFL